MDILASLLNNADDIAAKLGLPADQVKALSDSVTAKLGETGGDPMAALTAAVQENGLSMESLQGLLGNLGGAGGSAGGIMDMLDRDGDGNPINDLGGIAKGLFG